MKAVKSFVRQELAPLKKAINIILKRLDINFNINRKTTLEEPQWEEV
jgi:hypothetical protein